jgi:hypothetical protein
LKADLLGGHNEDVLKNALGLSPKEIDQLYAEKVLVRDPALAEPVSTPLSAKTA